MMSTAKQAVVLSGGSAYAAYEVGVLKALLAGESPATNYQPLYPAIYSGSSAGAFNAAILVSHPGDDDYAAVTYLEKVWSEDVPINAATGSNGIYRLRGDPRPFFSPVAQARHPLQPFLELAQDTAFFARDFLTRTVNFGITQATLGRRLLEFVDLTTFLTIEPFTNLIRKTVHLEAVRDSNRTLRIAATNWRTGTLRLFANADMTDAVGHLAILASATFPGLPPVEIGGEPYVDGGYVMNTPLSPAIDAGADVLHVVYLDPAVQNIPLRSFNNVIDVLDKLYVILMATIFNRDIDLLADIDRGLEVLEGTTSEDTPTGQDVRAFLRLAGRIKGRMSAIPYRKIALHRYRPDDDLGGVLGLLNFEPDHIRSLIDRGFRDAVKHDCLASECILPS